jgi:hypothetical protein
MRREGDQEKAKAGGAKGFASLVAFVFVNPPSVPSWKDLFFLCFWDREKCGASLIMSPSCIHQKAPPCEICLYFLVIEKSAA